MPPADRVICLCRAGWVQLCSLPAFSADTWWEWLCPSVLVTSRSRSRASSAAAGSGPAVLMTTTIIIIMSVAQEEEKLTVAGAQITSPALRKYKSEIMQGTFWPLSLCVSIWALINGLRMHIFGVYTITIHWTLLIMTGYKETELAAPWTIFRSKMSLRCLTKDWTMLSKVNLWLLSATYFPCDNHVLLFL